MIAQNRLAVPGRRAGDFWIFWTGQTISQIGSALTATALPHAQVRAIMTDSQGEEFKKFGMDLEFLLRQKPKWRVALQDILFFKEGDIVEHGEEAEEDEKDAS